ncbi:hypothetical protein [Actinomyces timonensis]|uniref:hypothetical protein n=1 Tax=Actinomyces timonensis TaxID=1288391 RepID=UPI0012B5A137|nr:hypothetical protein [Actinomyces timonensis]
MPTLRRTRSCALSVVAAAALAAVGAQAAPAHAAPTAADKNGDGYVATYELMRSNGRDLPGQVTTTADRKAGDGMSMTYSIVASLPDGDLGRMAVPLEDGMYAVPEGLRTQPATTPNAAATSDAVARAQTFVDAGNSITWDASRPTPLSGPKPVHQLTSAPYAVTCANFVGMVLVGLDYNHSTYVADKNTPVGYTVDFGQRAEGSELWQANHLASWFYAHGDMWLDTTGDYQPGDILFFSQQNPEGNNSRVRSGQIPTYFANVYHTAIYIGDGKVMQATGPGKGVTIDSLSGSLRDDITLVARPSYSGAPSGKASGGSSSTAAQPAPASPEASSGNGEAPSASEATVAATAAPTAVGAGAPSAEGTTPQPSPEANEKASAADPNKDRGLLASTGISGHALIAGLVLLSAGAVLLVLFRRRSQRAS